MRLLPYLQRSEEAERSLVAGIDSAHEYVRCLDAVQGNLGDMAQCLNRLRSSVLKASDAVFHPSLLPSIGHYPYESMGVALVAFWLPVILPLASVAKDLLRSLLPKRKP